MSDEDAHFDLLTHTPINFNALSMRQDKAIAFVLVKRMLNE